MTGRLIQLTVFATLVLSACRKEDAFVQEEEPGRPVPYLMQLPPHFSKPPHMESNPMTQEGVELGRRLFFDGVLSRTGTVSCSTCHQPAKAFADGLALSNLGVTGNVLDRHTPALINMAWQNNGLFWDGGSKNLESLVFGPLTHLDEMGMLLSDIPALMYGNADYVGMFQRAFPGKPISVENLAMALAQYQRTLISAGSRYDRFRLGERTSLGALQKEGLLLVERHCQPCHSGELFTDQKYHNNGLDDHFEDDRHEGLYFGRYRVTRQAMDLGAYRTPTLRNISMSAPYMHDGRFATLEDVLEHYRSGVKASPSLDKELLANGAEPGIPLSNSDVKAILAFLETLTDEEFLNQ